MTPSSKSSAMCQCFAVLEDGVLAHNLQEQEIEQYYTTNVQKNQLVQNDIRVAKRLQDEEEEVQAQQSTLHRQASRQLEEEDFEYARVIQEELQRCAEEAQRREQEDEEIAKRMQEEEEQRITRRSRGQDGHSEGSTSDPGLPSPHQHSLSSVHQAEEQYSSTTTRWQHSTSRNHSDLTGPQSGSPTGVAAQQNTTSWSNQGHTHSMRENRSELRERLSEQSEDSDTVFSEQLSAQFQRLSERHNTAPPRRQASLYQPRERNYRSLNSRSSITAEDRRQRNDDYYENDERGERKRWSRDQERNHRGECEGVQRSRDQNRDCSLGEERGRRCSHSESVRLYDRSKHSNRDLVRTWSYKDSPDKHVRFQDNARNSHRLHDETRGVWEMLGQVLRERGVPVRLGANGAPLQIRPQSRDSQVLHGSEVSCSDSQPHQRAFQRAAAARHSYHGDIRERRRSSYQENGRDHRDDRDLHRSNVADDGMVSEVSSRDSNVIKRDRGGSKRWREHRYNNDDERERNANDYRIKKTTSHRRHWHRTMEERSSSEEEQTVEMRAERPRRRLSQRSQSLRSSRDGPRRMAAGASLEPELDEASLDLGELRQVLQDEELAHKLQEEEETLMRRIRDSTNSEPSPRSSYPEGDFRVAQVAQDEEIARYMQKQEIKSKRRSRELEGPASWREHRAMMSHHDRRAARERPVQRERLDSEGLPSPTEDYSPDNQPPSPLSTIPQAQQIKNIAEELDPTFQARRQGPAGPACQSLPMPHSGLHDLLEEPTFIPPTKRQTDKSARTKPKEKKENCKQQ